VQQQERCPMPEWLTVNIRRFGTTQPPRPAPRWLRPAFDCEGEWVFITPALADHWLRHRNTNNRPIRPHREQRMTYWMANSLWDERTPQFILWDTTGALADGQHRLAGIRNSGVGFWFFVIWGLPPESRKHIDTQVSRSAADNLYLSGRRDVFGERSPRRVESIVRAFLQGGSTKKVELDAEELEQTFDHYRSGLSFALDLMDRLPGKKGVSRAMVWALAARAYYHVSDRDRLREFFRCLISGQYSDAVRDAAVVPYRDWLKDHSHHMNSNQAAEIYRRGVTALLAFIKRESRKLSRALHDDPFPLPKTENDDGTDGAPPPNSSTLAF